MNLHDLDIDVGQLRHQVTLQNLTETPDQFGQLQPGWSNGPTFWSRVEPLTGRELANAQQIKAEVDHAIIMRWDPNTAIDSTMRLTYGSRIFNIGGVINVLERNIKRVVYCTEQVTPAES